MGWEIESKQRIPDARAMERLLNDPELRLMLQEEPVGLPMTSFYYDTPALALSQRRWALRLRREGGAGVAALKTPRDGAPAGLTARGEWQCPAETIGEAIPALLRLGAPAELDEITRAQPLIERCRIVFTRLAGTLDLPGGAVAELAADEGVLYAGDKQEAFRELELELKLGDPAEVTALAARLAAAYGLTPERASKYERALRLVRSRRG
jgi:inorganic triphosphatase YgiF